MKARLRLVLGLSVRHGNMPSLAGLLGVVRAHHPDADLAPIPDLAWVSPASAGEGNASQDRSDAQVTADVFAARCTDGSR